MNNFILKFQQIILEFLQKVEFILFCVCIQNGVIPDELFIKKLWSFWFCETINKSKQIMESLEGVGKKNLNQSAQNYVIKIKRQRTQIQKRTIDYCQSRQRITPVKTYQIMTDTIQRYNMRQSNNSQYCIPK